MKCAPKEGKIKKLLQERGLAGAIVSSPENFHYLTGFVGHQHTVSRAPGFSLAVVSAAKDVPTHITTMDFEFPSFVLKNAGDFVVEKYSTWVGVKQWPEITMGKIIPEQTMVTSEDMLVKFMAQMDLANKKIGIELDYLPLNYYKMLCCRFPEAEFVDISDLFLLARSVKEPDEIEIFRTLCAAADNAFFEVSKIACIGVSERELVDCFRQSALASGVCIPSSWSMFSAGANASRLTLPTDKVAKDGEVIKFDAGVNAEFDFYTTDTSRTWIMGNGEKELYELKDRLYEAQRRMIAAIKPGLTFRELFLTGYEYVKEKYPCYRRGHMGHSISLGPATAECPYINNNTNRPLEPGMVLAVEAPCYIDGFNGFNIEDMIVVTDTGCEVLTPKTPHYL